MGGIEAAPFTYFVIPPPAATLVNATYNIDGKRFIAGESWRLSVLAAPFASGSEVSVRTIREGSGEQTVCTAGRIGENGLLETQGAFGADSIGGWRLEVSVSNLPCRDAIELSVSRPEKTVEPSDDMFFSEQWYLFNYGQNVAGKATALRGADVSAPEAWRMTRGSPDILVAIIDTGVAWDHPDLLPNMWTNPGESGDGKETNGKDDDNNGFIDDVRGWNFADNNNDPYDVPILPLGSTAYVNHGTAIASLVGAAGGDGLGVTGLSPGVRLLPIRAFGQAISDAAVARSIEYAAARRAKVVNLSVGTIIGGTLPLTASAIRNHPEMLFVAAAGNLGGNNDTGGTQPCTLDLPNLICVAATNEKDELAKWTGAPGSSNWGARTVHLGAPGSSLIVADVPRDDLVLGDFESPLDGKWITGGVNSRWGITTAVKRSGSGSLADSPDGNYLMNTDSWVRLSEGLPLKGKRGCRLDFYVQSALSAGDTLFFEISPDGQQWSVRGGFAVVGRSGEFRRYTIPLSERLDTLYIGFRLRTSQFSTGGDGVYIDDVSLNCQSPTFTTRSYAYVEGTSFAAPLVTAAAALVWSAQPAFTQTQVRDAILRNVDLLPSLAGKTVTGGRLNTAKALLSLPARTAASSSARIATVPDAGLTLSRSSATGGLVIGFMIPVLPSSAPPDRNSPQPPPWTIYAPQWTTVITQSQTTSNTVVNLQFQTTNMTVITDVFVSVAPKAAENTPSDRSRAANAAAVSFTRTVQAVAAFASTNRALALCSDTRRFIDFSACALAILDGAYESDLRNAIDQVVRFFHPDRRYPDLNARERTEIATALLLRNGISPALQQRLRHSPESFLIRPENAP